MKNKCENCFYYIHLEGRKPFCYKFFRQDPEPCEKFRQFNCSICLHGKGFSECQLKKKTFPKSNKCSKFQRYSGWSFDEE